MAEDFQKALEGLFAARYVKTIELKARKYYLREHPRNLYRVEVESQRVEVWFGGGWQPSIVPLLQLDGVADDVYYRLSSRDVEELTGPD